MDVCRVISSTKQLASFFGKEANAQHMMHQLQTSKAICAAIQMSPTESFSSSVLHADIACSDWTAVGGGEGGRSLHSGSLSFDERDLGLGLERGIPRYRKLLMSNYVMELSIMT